MSEDRVVFYVLVVELLTDVDIRYHCADLGEGTGSRLSFQFVYELDLGLTVLKLVVKDPHGE